MVVAVAQRTAQKTHLVRQTVRASHVTTLTTVPVAHQNHAKLVPVAQTMVATGLLVKTRPKAVAANVVAVSRVTATTVAHAATSLVAMTAHLVVISTTVLLAVTLVTATTVAHAATQTAAHHAANGLQSVQLVAHSAMPTVVMHVDHSIATVTAPQAQAVAVMPVTATTVAHVVTLPVVTTVLLVVTLVTAITVAHVATTVSVQTAMATVPTA
jgi:hypothetical protein